MTDKAIKKFALILGEADKSPIVRSLAAGVLMDPGSLGCERDSARHVRALFADADMVPAEEVTEIARYARDRAREGNASKDRDVVAIADSVLTMIALSKLPQEAVLVIGSRSETIVDPTGSAGGDRANTLRHELAREQSDLVDVRALLADSEGQRERLALRIAELEYAVGRAKEESAASLAHAETHLAERVKAERGRDATARELSKVLGERDNLGDSDAAKRIAADLRRSATGVDFGVPKGPNPIRTAADEVAAHFKTLRSELAKSVERVRVSADRLAECESKLRDALADRGVVDPS